MLGSLFGQETSQPREIVAVSREFTCRAGAGRLPQRRLSDARPAPTDGLVLAHGAGSHPTDGLWASWSLLKM